MKPEEIWRLELWEYNMFAEGVKERQKNDMALSILTGYYCAYYTNGGKKAKSPGQLIQMLNVKKESMEEGLSAIERIKELENRNKEESYGRYISREYPESEQNL